jgi:hypothetical protein
MEWKMKHHHQNKDFRFEALCVWKSCKAQDSGHASCGIGSQPLVLVRSTEERSCAGDQEPFSFSIVTCTNHYLESLTSFRLLYSQLLNPTMICRWWDSQSSPLASTHSPSHQNMKLAHWDPVTSSVKSWENSNLWESLQCETVYLLSNTVWPVLFIQKQCLSDHCSIKFKPSIWKSTVKIRFEVTWSQRISIQRQLLR